jgi:hypothetical protein
MRLPQLANILATILTLPLAAQNAFPTDQKLSSDKSAALKAEFGRLPLTFEANQGQTDSRVRFISRGSQSTLFLTDQEAVFSLVNHATYPRENAPSKIGSSDVIRMQLHGVQLGVHVAGQDMLEGKINYLIGSNQSKWHTSIPTYAQVRYTGVYPGIDLVYHGDQQRLEYDFVVAPDANPSHIRLHFEGASRISLGADGNLDIKADHGSIAFHRPSIYQEIGGRREPVSGSFQLLANNTVGFRLGSYDKNRAVVIDPVLVYSTYIGNGNLGLGTGGDIVVNSAGEAYIAGYAGYLTFPVTPGAFQTKPPAGQTVAGTMFVSKLNSAGTALIYSTYLSGDNTGYDAPVSLALDASGHALITSYTSDGTFPTTANAYQRTCGSPDVCSVTDSTVSELNGSGSGLVYSSFYGGTSSQPGAGSSETMSASIGADAAGNIYIAGVTDETNLPVLQAFQSSLGEVPPNMGGFLAKFDPKRSGKASLAYATYLSGSVSDTINSLAVDSRGDTYLTGYTNSLDFPVTSSAYQPVSAPDGGAFLSKIDTTKSGPASLAYSTYLSGSDGDSQGIAVAVDDTDHAYMMGDTREADFPTTPGAFSTTCPVQNILKGIFGTAAYVAKFDTAASGHSSLVYSTCLDSNSVGDSAGGIAIDSQGNAYVTGSLVDQYGPVQFYYNTTYPLVDPIQADATAKSMFISKLNPTGSALVWSTRFGGLFTTGQIALGPADDVFVASVTGQYLGQSKTFLFDPTTPISAGSFSPLFNPNCKPTDTLCREQPEVGIARISQSHGAFATINPLNAVFVETEIGIPAPTVGVALRDVGDKPFTINSIRLNGSDSASFDVTTSCPLGLFGPATSCPFTLSFDPKTAGQHTATLIVDDSAPGGPHTVGLSGYGDRFKVSAAKLAFSSTAVGTTSAAQGVTITNIALSRTTAAPGTAITGPFAVSTTCSGLKVDGNCNFAVAFTPTAIGPASGTLTLSETWNSQTTQQVIQLSGVGK